MSAVRTLVPCLWIFCFCARLPARPSLHLVFSFVWTGAMRAQISTSLFCPSRVLKSKIAMGRRQRDGNALRCIGEPLINKRAKMEGGTNNTYRRGIWASIIANPRLKPSLAATSPLSCNLLVTASSPSHSFHSFHNMVRILFPRIHVCFVLTYHLADRVRNASAKRPIRE